MSARRPDPSAALVGLDGLEAGPGPDVPAAAPHPIPLRLSPEAAHRIETEIARAGGREVNFIARVTPDRLVVEPRAVARGNHEAVLAVARDEPRGSIMVHNHPSGVLEPSEADFAVAASLWERGLGTAITDNRASALYVVVEPPEPRERIELDLEALEALVGPEGLLAGAHADYEDRAGQRGMLRSVAERYNRRGVLLVEAGTGTGKSLAYLIPAARWALDNGERTVVSTATINLQEQLVRQDLPLVARLFGTRAAEAGEGAADDDELTWALVKGRGNYISIRRLGLARAGAAELFETDRSHELDALAAWVGTTTDGSLADLASVPSDDVWDEVKSDPDACLRAKCPHFQQCFFQRSRRRAASARILVVNHHLLFTDLSVRRATLNFTQPAVLPAYRHVILDEAHNVEDAATAHLGAEVTRRGLYRVLARLDRRGRGVLGAVQDALRSGGEGAALELRRRIEDAVRPRVEEARARLEAFIEQVEPLVPRPPGAGDADGPEGGDAGGGGAVRIAGPAPFRDDPSASDGWLLAADVAADGTGLHEAGLHESHPDDAHPAGSPFVPGAFAPRGGGMRPEGTIPEPVGDPAVREALRTLLSALRTLERELGEVRRRIEESEELDELVGGRLLDLRGLERRIAAAQAALELVFEPGEAAGSYVRWLEVRGRGRRRNLAMAAAPIELGESLRTGLWSQLDTAILSSATLTTRRTFDFTRGRLGLEPGALASLDEPVEVAESLFDSPFDFARATLLAVPTDLPAVDAGPAFDDATARAVADMAAASGGGLFVLFTSYRALRAVAMRLRAGGLDRRFALFVHGEADRARLLEGFVRDGNGVLLGTASFWEGVDVPGDPLRGLVIPRLPFRVPTEPVVAARVEALEMRGGNAFHDYMLPMGALRLKQGFGRLVRRRTDRGAVVILDDRLVRRRYGAYLRDSLPPAPFAKGPWDEVLTGLRRFYRDLS